MNNNSRQLTLLKKKKAGDDDFTTLDLVERLVELCIWMPSRSPCRLAMALWAMHVHVYDQFDHTPRLALLSPAPGFGKSQVLKLLQFLAPLPKPDLIVDPTPAGLYQSIDAGATALLIDEVDNLNLPQNGKMRIILNAFEKGTAIPRGRSAKKGSEVVQPKFFRPFIPIAIAAIGKLPKPLMTRCVAIHMRKRPENLPQMVRINTADEKFVEAANLVLGSIMRWSSNIVLDQDPNLGGLNNRFADVWRPLIAIAETFGRGDDARNAARAITGLYVEYDDGTQLLIDIRAIFNKRKIDRIEREDLLHELLKLDRWNEWGRVSPLTKNELLSMLRDYHVPVVHTVRIKRELVQGWYRKDFEQAWMSLPPAARAARSGS